MAAFSLSSIPWWGWVLLVAAAVVIAPIKLRIMKKMLSANKEKPAEDE